MGLVIWVGLILALVVPKTNHDLRVLWILVPLAIVNILWWIFMKLAGMNSTDAQQFTLVFNSMAVGVTVLWLIANSFVRFGGAIRFLLSFMTVIIVAGLGILSYSSELSNETALFLIFFAFMDLTMLASITLSRRLCKKKCRPVYFMLWLLFWILLASLVAIAGFIAIGSMIVSSWPDLHETVIIFGLGELIFGLCLYVLNLPFMILGFVHPFFRARFCACLGLKPKAITVNSKIDSGGSDGGQSSIQ